MSYVGRIYGKFGGRKIEQEEVWDAIGEHWKDFRRKVPPTVEWFLEGKKGKILDVGCGSGRNAPGRESKVKSLKIEVLEFYGVDFSSKMVELARGKNYSGVKKGEIVAIPYGDSFFDYVLCYAVLHCVDSVEARRKALEEIYRVLKSGGEALISVWGPKSPRLKNKGKECFVPWSVREGERIKRYTYVYDLEELKGLCEDVGFEVVRAWEERNVNLVLRKG